MIFLCVTKQHLVGHQFHSSIGFLWMVANETAQFLSQEFLSFYQNGTKCNSVLVDYVEK